MNLQKETYTGDIHQKIIVSAENGRRHIATNPSGQYEVRHYRLDGALIKNEQCCDMFSSHSEYCYRRHLPAEYV